MLAIVYLIIVFLLGDSLCRRFFIFSSLGHRISAAVLTGLLVGTWATYGLAYLFHKTGAPLLWGNAVFMAAALVVAVLLKWRPGLRSKAAMPDTEFVRWDWVFVGIFVVLTGWMMFSTFSATGDRLLIGNHQWSDFGSNISVMRSFSVGNNFPTEYPHFSGDRIRYHFLFYFAAGNLGYLGLDPAWANNLLSVLTMVSMLMLVMTIGAVLFGSRVVGRIGALLFFFHGSLSYFPFLIDSNSISAVFNQIWKMQAFLPSGFPYRGEDWGVWSQVVYLNQRHFASSIGILLLVLSFLLIYLKTRASSGTSAEPSSAGHSEPSQNTSSGFKSDLVRYVPFVFAGCLLGLMPMWNGAVFVGAASVMGVLLILLPIRKEMLLMGVISGLLALPQVLYLKTGAKPPPYSLFHWGYTIDDPTLINVAWYLFFTFGFKLVLIAVALIWGSSLQRKVMAALASLIIVTFCFQFSEEVLANHKFLNIWLIGANLYVAYGLVLLWNIKIESLRLPARLAGIVLVLLIVVGGVIDLLIVKNIYWVEAKYDGDAFVEWVKENTDERSIFLSNRYVNHGILMAGRRLFYGHPYYAWGAGYPTNERDKVYKRMLESREPSEIIELLKANNISYVAIDNSLRKSDFVTNLNERFFEQHFPLVFEDRQRRYDDLKVYFVAGDVEVAPRTSPSISPTPVRAVANALEGGEGSGGGQFSGPKGIAVDRSGFIYVADTGNHRIQKFTPDGVFVQAFGSEGYGIGELIEPNGVAVSNDGMIFVVDAFKNKLVKFSPDGTFVGEWKGPEPGFYGPRDLVFGKNDQLHIVDQGRTRIVTFDPATEAFRSWGSAGSGPGQFKESTGIAAGDGLIFVADLGNDRIQVFDEDGNYVREWPVPQWGKYPWHYPDIAFDERTQRLFATNGWKDELLEFDLNGKLLGSDLDRRPILSGPSSLTLGIGGDRNRLLILNTKGSRIEAVRLDPR